MTRCFENDRLLTFPSRHEARLALRGGARTGSASTRASLPVIKFSTLLRSELLATAADLARTKAGLWTLLPWARSGMVQRCCDLAYLVVSRLEAGTSSPFAKKKSPGRMAFARPSICSSVSADASDSSSLRSSAIS